MASMLFNKTPPKWFTPVALLALAWNGLGMAVYLSQVTMTSEAFSQLPQLEQRLMEATPNWVTGIFAAAVTLGVLGALGLVIKKGWAVPLLTLSFIAVLIQMGHWLFIAGALASLGPQSVAMPAVVTAVALFILLLSRKAIASGWIR